MRHKLVAIFTIFMVCACGNRETEIPPQAQVPVSWEVVSVNGFSTKALIENKEDIKDACKPTNKGGKGHFIGIWADYSAINDGKPYEVTNIFNGTRLRYNPDGQDGNGYWQYAGTTAYWVLGGKYVFRAFYPQEQLNISNTLSNAKTLVIEMNTSSTQTDMLLAHNSYDTATKENAFGEIQEMTDPIMLNFRHAMSALMFRFKFDDMGDAILYAKDAITECWMDVDKDDSFAITGYMVYGDGKTYEEGPIQWRNQYCPTAGTTFYNWKSPLSTGVEFENRRPSDPSAEFDKTKDQTVATVYTPALTRESAYEASDDYNGKQYTKNGGWLLVIPQRNNGELRLCFRTVQGGESVFSVPIPMRTGTCQEEYRLHPYDNTKHKSADDSKNVDYVPGWRYTYTVSISKTQAKMSLDIAPWKRLDSSFEIKFN